MDLRARIAALTPVRKAEAETPPDTSRLRDRLRRLRGPVDEISSAEIDPDEALLEAWRADVDRAAAAATATEPKPKRKKSPPLEAIEGATVIGEGDNRYLRIDRPLDDEVRDGALHWLHLWDARHVHALAVDGRLRTVDPRRALFIDTETTGLGGASSLVFLIGCVHWLDGRLHLTQFFLFGPGGERRLLDDLLSFIGDYDFLVSYNGRAFDVRALCDRFVMSGLQHGPQQLELFPHLDLLPPARRIWRHALKDCRLVTIEQEVLRRARGDDIDGMQIPMIYYNYLRYGRLKEIHKVIRHNEWDTVSLALLGSAMMRMLTDPSTSVAIEPPTHGPDARRERRHGEQMVGLGSLHIARGDVARAVEALEHGLENASPTSRYVARKRLAALHKKQGDYERALPLWHAMIDDNALVETHAYTEIAKYLEHRARDAAAALQVVARAETEIYARRGRGADAEWDALQQRRTRLEQTLARREPVRS